MDRRDEGGPERACGRAEYLIRRVVSSLFYFRLYRWCHPDNPYYVPRAIRRIGGLLDEQSRVFEWGSGASTLWYARHAATVVSVEHDAEWHRKGVLALQKNETKNTALVFAPPADARPSSWEADWPHYSLLGHPPDKPEFYDYMRKIDEYPDGFFDCVAIDGRERVGCLAHALSKLSQRGFIVLDDSHRPKYRQFFEILSAWRTERFDFGLIQTTIFTREEQDPMQAATHTAHSQAPVSTGRNLRVQRRLPLRPPANQ